MEVLKKKAIAAATLSLALIPSFGANQMADAKEKKSADSDKAKNVIMFVGVGMGASHRKAIRLAAQSLDGELAMNNKPVTGNVDKKKHCWQVQLCFYVFGK
ncbi:alkaline phosphatase [Fictibacillus solisalsi]|uniref:Alkaline phosphatase n=1 Tax=Fictibacillus solisalsi TaxID=459525 RepID=A0A1G9TYC6_9BACL|nr:hypothetical protein [Fictibacillus solisalsi]SDM52628.1 alkaline phosphatase [Fictibacillus solisalsi]